MSAIGIFITKAKATAAITTKVPKANMHPITWPQTAQPPAIVVNKVGGKDEQMLDGPGGYWEGRLRVEALALTGTDAEAISKALIDNMGAVTKASIGDYRDVDIIYLDDFSDWADDRSMCRFTIDFSVRYRNAA